MPDTIICPNCQFEIEVTEVLSAQLRTQLRKEFEADIRKKEAAIAEREKEVSRSQEAVELANQDIERRVAEQLAKERKTLSEECSLRPESKSLSNYVIRTSNLPTPRPSSRLHRMQN